MERLVLKKNRNIYKLGLIRFNMEKSDIFQFIALCFSFFIIGWIFSLILVGYSEDKCDTEQGDIALLHAENTGIYQNIDNPNEMFFDYYIYNFGNAEAKNVVITCKLFDEEYNRIKSADQDYGNIASNSYEFEELISPIVPDFLGNEYYSICYVKSCDNCKILSEDIPELMENYRL